MLIYKVTGDKSLKQVEDQLPTDGIMVKIRKVMPMAVDVDYFSGKKKAPQISPCHMATAYVSDDYEEYGLKQGEKVILNPYIEENPIDNIVSGVNTDGFLREFMCVDPSQIVPLPDGVDEDDALFTDLVGIALGAFSKLHAKKGDYVAIIGGGVISVIIAELAIYFGYIPVYISADKTLLEIVKSSGVYYVIDSTTEDVRARVLEITGGRLAERTILECRENVITQYLFALAGEGGESVVVSIHDNYASLATDLYPMVSKNLSVYGVSDARAQFVAALNIIAQGTLKLKGLIDKTVQFTDAEKLFKELSDNKQAYIAPIIVLPGK